MTICVQSSVIPWDISLVTKSEMNFALDGVAVEKGIQRWTFRECVQYLGSFHLRNREEIQHYFT